MASGKWRTKASITLVLASVGLALLLVPLTSGSQSVQAANSCGWVCTQIKHVVIIEKENRSFDNLFARFPGADGTKTVQRGAHTYPIPQTPLVLIHDIAHSTQAAVTAENGGKMNMFYKLLGSQQGKVNVADTAYTQDEIPLYWAYAQTYTLADHYFSSFSGPSYPNHLPLIMGSLNHVTGDPRLTETAPGVSTFVPRWGCDSGKTAYVPVRQNGVTRWVKPCWNNMTIADEANKAGVSWHYYANPKALPDTSGRHSTASSTFATHRSGRRTSASHSTSLLMFRTAIWPTSPG